MLGISKQKHTPKLMKTFRNIEGLTPGKISMAEFWMYTVLEQEEKLMRVFTFINIHEETEDELTQMEFCLIIWNICTLDFIGLCFFLYDVFDEEGLGRMDVEGLELLVEALFENDDEVNTAHIVQAMLPEEFDPNTFEMSRKTFVKHFMKHPQLLKALVQIQEKVKKTVGGGKGFWRKAVLARRAAGRKNMHRAHKVILDFVRLEEELERRPDREKVLAHAYPARLPPLKLKKEQLLPPPLKPPPTLVPWAGENTKDSVGLSPERSREYLYSKKKWKNIYKKKKRKAVKEKKVGLLEQLEDGANGAIMAAEQAMRDFGGGAMGGALGMFGLGDKNDKTMTEGQDEAGDPEGDAVESSVSSDNSSESESSCVDEHILKIRPPKRRVAGRKRAFLPLTSSSPLEGGERDESTDALLGEGEEAVASAANATGTTAVLEELPLQDKAQMDGQLDRRGSTSSVGQRTGSMQMGRGGSNASVENGQLNRRGSTSSVGQRRGSMQMSRRGSTASVVPFSLEPSLPGAL